jgi:hypothetical protein
MLEFVDNDAAYFAWLGEHTQGYVVNCYRNPTPSYLVLHRTSCYHIQRWQGRRSTADYRKMCADTEQPLEDRAAGIGGTLTRCRSCQP